jgi:hypothetical protein
MTSREQFKDLKAASLWCHVCGVARPVRERLLLVLPDGDLHEYRCTTCHASVGTRKVGRRPAAKIALR